MSRGPTPYGWQGFEARAWAEWADAERKRKAYLAANPPPPRLPSCHIASCVNVLTDEDTEGRCQPCRDKARAERDANHRPMGTPCTYCRNRGITVHAS